MKDLITSLIIILSSTINTPLGEGLIAESNDPLYGIDISPEYDHIPYVRKSYSYSVDYDHDGQYTRAETLISRSLVAVTFNDDRRKIVRTGKWFDAYTGVTFRRADDVDIDHLVPLYEVHVSGGYGWSNEKKRSYANDLGETSPLRVVHRWTNRIPKSADDPGLYSPSYVPARCTYLYDWIAIKRKWQLTMDPDEAASIRRQIKACD